MTAGGKGAGMGAVLAAHAIVYENDGGDYGGRSWFECSCDADNVAVGKCLAWLRARAEQQAHSGRGAA